MAPDVIDLVTDSEDESPMKAATSTLQAFGPRKEKDTPSRNGAKPRPFANAQQFNSYGHPHAHPIPAPAAPSNYTGAQPGPSLSISEILKQSALGAVRSIGLAPEQNGIAQRQTNGSVPREAQRIPPRQLAPALKNPNSRATDHLQYNAHYAKQQSTGDAHGPSESPRSSGSGPLWRERQRKYDEYRRKEAERNGERTSQDRGLSPDTPAGATNQLAPSIEHPNVSSTAEQAEQLSKGSGSRRSSSANGGSQPEPKRQKQTHDEGPEIDNGMREARNLSASGCSKPRLTPSNPTHVLDLSEGHAGGIQQAPSADLFSGTLNDNTEAHSAIVDDQAENNVVHVFGKAHDGIIDLTEEVLDSMHEPESQPSSGNAGLANQLGPVQSNFQTEYDVKPPPYPTSHSDDDGSSPDEIPARAKLVSRRKMSVLDLCTPPPPDASLGGAASERFATVDTNFASDSIDRAVPYAAANPAKTPINGTEQQTIGVLSSAGQPTKDRLHELKQATKGQGGHGVPYSPEEDALLAFLREEGNFRWEEMPSHFSGRTKGSLMVRYSAKLKDRKRVSARPQGQGLRKVSSSAHQPVVPQDYAAPSRRQPKVAPRNDGFISWAEVKARRQDDGPTAETVEPLPAKAATVQEPSLALDVAHPSSMSRLLRCREIGNDGGRNWSSTTRMRVPDELQNHVLDTLGPRRFFHGASRDVTCVAWANDGNRFAAGAIAIDDERSMQYNRPNNLLLGNLDHNSLTELPEHHVPRPIVSDSHNVNSLHAMQESQDPRLFKTVAAVDFSEDSRALYTAGADGVVRMYDSSNGRCLSSYKQEGELALITTSSRGLLASGCRRSDDGSISIVRCHSDMLEPVAQIGPSRMDVQSSLPIFPSALKWGIGKYNHLLLAGFASDSYEEDRLSAGELCLWDATADRKIEIKPMVRNVFDVAWNPSPSAGSGLFAVACARSGKHFRSSVQCFAPDQGRASRVQEWDCPAYDINDVVCCPHDDNIIAAGATDGKVYIWDKRKAKCGQMPLHIFSHDQTKNALDHDRELEIADTGVRFLSWSATGNRLYSGSSDGTVKVWNPYRPTQDALVRNVATFNSAVMSGAFSPDYRDLLIGEDQGQLNLLGIDRAERSVRAAKKFDYYPAPTPTTTANNDKLAPARALLATRQIEVRPMGVLPVKQAVQGPNYQGPFMAPSDGDLMDLETRYQWTSQKARHAAWAMGELPDNEDLPKKTQAAESEAQRIQDKIRQARQKREDAEDLRPAALQLQKTFREARHALKKDMVDHATRSCKLDCNYLPAAGDDDGEAPDDHRSEQRIPGKSISQRISSNTTDLTNAEIAEAGLTSKCSACMGPTAKPKRGLPVCGRCALTRSGLSARCEKCAAPVRPNLDERVTQNVCERCNFHCFRCGCIANISPDGVIVTCEPCGMQWEAGILGYEVKRSFKPSDHVKKREHEQVMESLEQRMGRLFGDGERERLARGWKVGLVDGPVA